ncbi:MAG: 4Fe-4S binding protein [Planctomycetota bacterium]
MRALILWWGFPYLFQVLLLIVFVGLAIIAWGHFAPEGVNGKLYAKTNLVTLLIWGLWWPAMVWLAVLFGRIWCMVCPLELVSNLSERIGRGLGLPQLNLRPWIAAGALILLLYAVILFLVPGANIHRVPHYTSLFLIGLLGLTVITGLFFKDRAFCRGFCPVGLLLGTYGRGSMLVVRSGSQETCQSCTGKECILSGNRNKADGRSCPSLLNPPKLDSNRDCLVCGQCIKACSPDNMQLLLRRPFHQSDTRESMASWPITLFVMLVSGFVIYELCSEWAAAKKIFLALPVWTNQQLGVPFISGYITGIWMLVAVPLVTWTFLGGLGYLLEIGDSISQVWRRLALPMAVVISAGHMAKGLAKFVSWAGYLPHALKDTTGINTILALERGDLPPPQTLMAQSVVSWIGLILIVLAMALSIREARMARPGIQHRQLLPIIVFALACLYLIFGW